MVIKKDFRIILAGGGTGGHLYSGIAVADEVRQQYPDAKILFVGTDYGLEKEIVPKAGYQLKLIEVSPLKGTGVLSKIRSLLQLPKAYFQSKKIIKNFKPDIVIGIGGYASGPMTLTAHFQKIFTAIIEQNSFPGFTNRKLGKYVDRIFISFEKTKKFFDPQKTILTGNPVRNLQIDPSLKKEGGRFTLLVMGGSQGAHILNTSMIEALPLLKDSASKLHFIHQTGKNDFEEVQDAYQQQEFSAEVYPFIDEMGPFYSKSDLGLLRAGAGTITEIREVGLPAILVPYPFAADDHQRYNAQEMVDQGAAEMILNKDLNGKIITERITHYLANPDRLKEMHQQAKKQAKPQAARDLLNHCLISLA